MAEQLSEHAKSIARALMEGKYGSMDSDIEFDADGAPANGYGGFSIKMSKKTMMLVGGVALLALVAGGGYAYYKKQQEKKEQIKKAQAQAQGRRVQPQKRAQIRN
jgi:type IV secretory pathway VirB10-like protein